MTIIITIFNAILCVNLVPVQSHYLYADNPNAGYVSLNNAGDSFPMGFNAKQRRYLAHPNGQTYKTNEWGSSKITKSPSVAPSTHDLNHKPTANLKPTEAPKKQQKKEEVKYVHDARNYKALRGKGGQNYKQDTKTNPREKEYTSQTKQYDPKFNVKGNYDNKGNSVQVNVHKTQIPAEPQKVKLNSNRQLTALSVQRREDNYRKMPTSVLVDKTLQTNGNFKERNAQIMSRVLDDMTKKVSDRRVKSNDFKKRDTGSSFSKSSTKRNAVSENMKKYIGKDGNMAKEYQSKDAPSPRIGSREEEIEETNAPYALFYRMSPESLDNQEGFYLMKTMEDEGEPTLSNKEKRLTVNYQNEVDLKKPKTKKNYNTVKLKKKVKNMYNFRNNNI